VATGELVSGAADAIADEVAIAQLWAQAAHDLRQPVQAALLLTKMLDGSSGQSELRRTARHIAMTLNSLYGMLEFLTLLSRIEAGLARPPLRHCQLAEVLAVPLREMAKVAAKRGISLRMRNLRGQVRANPSLLAMTTKSLLLNAIKFGSGDQIVAGCHRQGDHVSLEIAFRAASRDPASEKSAFFELSTQAGGQIACELGIGLLLLERLCRRLGHRLEHAPAPPDGRRLVLRLPRATGRP
jgi:signal transduction histidine kinase